MGPDAPVVGHVTALPADWPSIGAGAGGLMVRTGKGELIVGTTGGGLRPPASNSVEPNGIPVRPPDDTEPIAVGDEADAADPVRTLPVVAVQPPDVVPLVPPPSKTEVEPDMPVVELVLEPAVPQGELPSVGETPDVVGLTPGDASSTAPWGMPVGATADPGPMPRGEVMPSGDPPTCAIAEPPPNRATARVAATKRIIIVRSSSDTLRRARRPAGCATTLWRIYARPRRYAVGVRPVIL